MREAAEHVHDEPNLLSLFDAQPLSVSNKVKVGGQVHIAQDLSPRKKMSLQQIHTHIELGPALWTSLCPLNFYLLCWEALRSGHRGTNPHSTIFC